MAETTLSMRQARSGREGDANGARPLRRRRALPGGRAVVGGFLVALAAVGVFAGYTGATADTREPYLVARQDLPLGHRITRADLGALPMDLPALLRAKAYRDPAQLIGTMVIGPVTKGELVQASSVRAGGAGSSERQISFAIDSARAVNGQLRRGEFVDVVATYGTGTDGYTEAVVRAARVADRSETRGALSSQGNEVVTLTVPGDAAALAVAHAVSTGTIMLVRSPAPPGSGGLLVETPFYRPTVPPADKAGTGTTSTSTGTG